MLSLNEQQKEKNRKKDSVPLLPITELYTNALVFIACRSYAVDSSNQILCYSL